MNLLDNLFEVASAELKEIFENDRNLAIEYATQIIDHPQIAGWRSAMARATNVDEECKILIDKIRQHGFAQLVIEKDYSIESLVKLLGNSNAIREAHTASVDCGASVLDDVREIHEVVLPIVFPGLETRSIVHEAISTTTESFEFEEGLHHGQSKCGKAYSIHMPLEFALSNNIEFEFGVVLIEAKYDSTSVRHLLPIKIVDGCYRCLFRINAVFGDKLPLWITPFPVGRDYPHILKMIDLELIDQLQQHDEVLCSKTVQKPIRELRKIIENEEF